MTVPIPSPCPNENLRDRMRRPSRARSPRVHACRVLRDIFLEDGALPQERLAHRPQPTFRLGPAAS